MGEHYDDFRTIERAYTIVAIFREGTKELAFLYLGSIYFSSLLEYSVIFFSLLVFVKVTSKIIENIRLHHRADSLVRDIRDALKIGSPGMLTGNETSQVAKRIFSIINENEKREKESCKGS